MCLIGILIHFVEFNFVISLNQLISPDKYSITNFLLSQLYSQRITICKLMRKGLFRFRFNYPIVPNISSLTGYQGSHRSPFDIITTSRLHKLISVIKGHLLERQLDVRLNIIKIISY